MYDLPAVSLVPFCNIFGKGNIGGTVYRDIVFIVVYDEFPKFERTSKARCFGRNAFH